MSSNMSSWSINLINNITRQKYLKQHNNCIKLPRCSTTKQTRALISQTWLLHSV